MLMLMRRFCAIMTNAGSQEVFILCSCLALFQFLRARTKLSGQLLTDPLDSGAAVVVVQAVELAHGPEFTTVFPSKRSVRLPPGPRPPAVGQRDKRETC